jgi:hypothetical protein
MGDEGGDRTSAPVSPLTTLVNHLSATTTPVCITEMSECGATTR